MESGRSTQWQRYTPSEEARAQLLYTRMPRRQLRINELNDAVIGSSFDCTALALHVGSLHEAGGEIPDVASPKLPRGLLGACLLQGGAPSECIHLAFCSF